jgi:hypothetical protein
VKASGCQPEFVSPAALNVFLAIALLMPADPSKPHGNPRSIPHPQCNKICPAAPENARATVE